MSVEFEIESDYRKALPPNGATFLETLASSLDDDLVVSVLLFGSVIRGETTAISDIDLLVVLADDADKGDREAVQSTAVTLAEKHLDVERERRNPIEQAVDRATGMFRSGFVVTEREVKAGRFHAIFNTSRLVYLLAPWRTVLRAVFSQAEPIYGPSVSPDWTQVTSPETRRGRELIRSWLMATLLATAQLAYAFVSSRAIQYAMEAHKWTLYNCAFHFTGRPAPTLAAAVDVLPGSSDFNERLLDLRRSLRFDRAYIVLVPLYVTLVHVQTFLALVKGEQAGGQGD